MSIYVGVTEARAHFSELLSQANLGEEIVIEKRGEALARIVPAFARKNKKRMLGTAKGLIRMSDDFDAPLPDDLLKEFYK